VIELKVILFQKLVMRNASWPDINISPQVLISCSMKDDGCQGGDSLNAFEYLINHLN
jgi:hypothetical protein